MGTDRGRGGDRTLRIEELARYIKAAYLAWKLGVSLQEGLIVVDAYATKEDGVGQGWISIADLIHRALEKAKNEHKSRSNFPAS